MTLTHHTYDQLTELLARADPAHTAARRELARRHAFQTIAGKGLARIRPSGSRRITIDYSGDCPECGVWSPQLHRHHDDYALAFDTRQICLPCHQDWHRHHVPAYPTADTQAHYDAVMQEAERLHLALEALYAAGGSAHYADESAYVRDLRLAWLELAGQ